MINRGLPNFLIAGAAQAGTTFLASALRQHPNVFMPEPSRSEPHYFYYADRARRPLSWYVNSWFAQSSSEKTVGEKSSSYLFGINCARRIADALPKVKLVFLLRNPYERAYANYRFSVLQGLEDLTFAAALRAEIAGSRSLAGRWAEVQPFAYIGRSRYFLQLARYLELFAASQILILKSEEMFREPFRVFDLCFEFLGVERNLRPVLPEIYSIPRVRDSKTQGQLRRYFGERFPELIEALRKTRELPPLSYEPEEAAMGERLRGNLSWEREAVPLDGLAILQEDLYNDLRWLQGIVEFSVPTWFDDRGSSHRAASH